MNSGPDIGRGLWVLVTLAAVGVIALIGAALYGAVYLSGHLTWQP